MQKQLRFPCAVLLTGLVLAFMPRIASAQALSKWGNPVVSFGATPYHAVSTGHGNYPGSDGFIPGYGYYGNYLSHYPWLGGPDSEDYPRYRRAQEMSHQPEPGAVLSVRVPAAADIWIADGKTSQRGEWRQFATPLLAAGQTFTYEIRARWQENGKDVERTREIQVRAGDRLTVDFLETGPARTLPMPRRLEER